jgi:hypothetical protein
MIMTKNKAQKSAIRQRMAETGEPYSVARHAVEASQPAAAEGWNEEYYADGAASEGITVAEFKAREAAGNPPPEVPIADAQAAGGPVTPSLGEAALAGGRLASEPRQQGRGDAPGIPPMPPMPPMPPVPPVPPRFAGSAWRTSGSGPVQLTEDEVRELSPFLQAAQAAADQAQEAAAQAAEWAARVQEQAARAGERAGRAGERAGRAGERAGRAGERAGRAGERAGRAGERAGRAEDWAGQEEPEGADEVPERAELTGELAEQAEEQAMQAQEWAELARDRADEARDRADEAREWADQAREWPSA